MVVEFRPGLAAVPDKFASIVRQPLLLLSSTEFSISVFAVSEVNISFPGKADCPVDTMAPPHGARPLS